MIRWKNGWRFLRTSLCAAPLAWVAVHCDASAGVPSPEESRNVRRVGYSDLQGRESLQVAAKGTWLYVGHHEGRHPNPLKGGADEWNGTTILDISDPARPAVVAHIPNAERANSRAVQAMHDYRNSGKDLLVRNHERPGAHRFEIFDVTKKDSPVFVASITETPDGPLTSAHKGWWDETTGLFYHSSNEPGFRAQHLIIHRIEIDPSGRVRTPFVGRAWLPGQKEGDPVPADGEIPGMHHPVVDPENRRVYAAFLFGGDVAAWDVTDPAAPVLKWHIDTHPPGSGTHTATPVFYRFPGPPGKGRAEVERRYVLVSDEVIGGCSGPVRERLHMMEITRAESTGVPTPVAAWQVPEGDFCSRGGRFGPHQYAETKDGRINRFGDRLAWVAYFNAGVRVLDISDPLDLKEVGHYIPRPAGGSVLQMNDVDLDYRGFAYASDRVGNGLYVLEYTGEKRGR